MCSQVVVVESPTKAKTFKKYLDGESVIIATGGHVRDLLPKEGAVEPENQFHMNYAVIDRNRKNIDAIAKAMSHADTLVLATDPDREGEAIAWHLYELIKDKRAMKNKKVVRVVFHEITKKAVLEALAQPRQLQQDLINAQLARRCWDYLVGFFLSPLLWTKVRPGLSAGRVQSPALRMIVEREEEIERFVSQEYWHIEAKSEAQGKPFTAKLTVYQGTKQEQFSITNEADATAARAYLLAAAHGHLVVSKVERKQRKRNPAAPFITSTLQQEAARKLGFGAARTMRVAQQLYEGITLGHEGNTGLITYMRTDSVSLAGEAIDALRGFIAKRYGKDMLPQKPRIYKTSAKNAQEAHEAIRPTDPRLTPDMLKEQLSADQYKLYNLIWKRSIACQMISASINTIAVELQCGDDSLFRASGSQVVNPGFLAVYEEGLDDKKSDTEETWLPPLETGEKVALIDIVPNQHFTEPPPRFSEASLVKALEEYGIGRPSTYATIISTLQAREYVVLDKKRFYPTDVGRVVNRFLSRYFSQYVDYQFTAKLEDQLDEISRGETAWIPLMEKLWGPFKILVDETKENVSRKEVTQEALDEQCPQCGEGLSIRLGKRGRFIGCTAYPDCDYTRNLGDDSQVSSEPEVLEGRECPKCSSVLHIKHGRYGKFIGCSAYPKCKFIEPLEKPKDTGVTCPTCQQGPIVQRKSRRGKIFFSCQRYPDCQYALWNPPLPEPCPKCQWPILSLKTTKKSGIQKVCPQKECGFIQDVED